MHTSSIACVVFDLGGVLVEVDSAASISKWLGTSDHGCDLSRMSLDYPAVQAFETGRMDAATFAAEITRNLDFAVSSDDFLAEFRGWVRRPFYGCRTLLKRLKTATPLTLACLSNTNSIHWERIRDDLGLADYFDHVFLSCVIGARKPDPRAYEAMLEGLPFHAGDILFLDDRQENVVAARQVGLRSQRVDGVKGVWAALDSVGIPVRI